MRRLERVYSSYLKRAIKTAWLMLDELELQWVPISYSWRLNERHYGLLQGKPKRECSERYGVKQVQKWRRGVNYPPPPWDENTKASTIDRRYDGVDVPESESLAQCTARLRPFLSDELKPAMRESIKAAEAEQQRYEQQRKQQQKEEEDASGSASGVARAREISAVSADDGSGEGGGEYVPAYVIASSENLIRALVAELEGISDEDVPLLDIPYATPLVYQFDAELNPLPSSLAEAPLRHGYYLGDMERIREVQRDIRESLVCGTGQTGFPEDSPPCDMSLIDEDQSCFVPAGASGDGEAGEYKWVCSDEDGAQGNKGA